MKRYRSVVEERVEPGLHCGTIRVRRFAGHGRSGARVAPTGVAEQSIQLSFRVFLTGRLTAFVRAELVAEVTAEICAFLPRGRLRPVVIT